CAGRIEGRNFRQAAVARCADGWGGFRAFVHCGQPRCRAVARCVEKAVSKVKAQLHRQGDRRRGGNHSRQARCPAFDGAWLRSFLIARRKPSLSVKPGAAPRPAVWSSGFRVTWAPGKRNWPRGSPAVWACPAVFIHRRSRWSTNTPAGGCRCFMWTFIDWRRPNKLSRRVWKGIFIQPGFRSLNGPNDGREISNRKFQIRNSNVGACESKPSAKPSGASPMKILAIEFSSEQRSVAVLVDGRVLGVATESSTRATPAIGLAGRALTEAGLEREEIECLAIGLGPGSYTGIRSAIALAQGWQLASSPNGVKLLGLSSAACLA